MQPLSITDVLDTLVVHPASLLTPGTAAIPG
jgi:hypothetical protein